MSAADPPGLPSCPMSGGTSQWDAQVSDQEKHELESGDLNLNTAKDLGERSLKKDGSRDLSLRSQELESTKEGLDQEVIKDGSKGSWLRAVQGQKVLKKYEVDVTMKDGIGSGRDLGGGSTLG